MKVCGIIAEYNPFHTGHAYQLKYVRETLGAGYIVVCMSGDFVQRGAPAVLDKYERTRAALSAGADLVLEIPAANAVGSAEFFASGAVSLLDALGIVDCLCFGCEDENPDPSSFLRTASFLNTEPPAYREALKTALSAGMSFPDARASAMKEQGFEKEASLLSEPNNILGVEYCRSILKLGSTITPCPLHREGSGYHSEEILSCGFSSAAALRKVLYGISKGKADFTPEQVVPEGLSLNQPQVLPVDLLPEQVPPEGLSWNQPQVLPDSLSPKLVSAASEGWLIFPEDFDQILFYQLLKENWPGISEYQDVTPELGKRILQFRNRFAGFESFAAEVKTKNYTYTRVQRSLIHILLGIKEIRHNAGYARILGFRKDSSYLLSEIHKKSRIPLISRPSGCTSLSPSVLTDYELTVNASNLYEAVKSLKTGRPFVHEYQHQMIVL